METQLLSISKIFTERLYRIPDYQRGYAWVEKQLKDYWNDVLQLEEGKNHYVGVLTLEMVPPEVYGSWEDDKWIIDGKSFEPYYVVDGQQRLTTTIILIQAITEKVDQHTKLNYNTIDEIKKRYIFDSKDEGISRSYIFGYEKDNPSYEYLKTKVFNEQSSGSYRNEETIYTQNLSFAKEYFLECLKELPVDAIENIFKKVTQHFLFNIYSITSDIDVFVAFETMNNRGKPLSVLELLKNRLIYLSTKFNEDETDKNALRKKINDSWKSIYHHLGRNKDIPLDDDVFLVNHMLIYFGKLRNAAIEIRVIRGQLQTYKHNLEELLLNNVFQLRKINSETEGGLTINSINKYVEHLQKSVSIWYDIHNSSKKSFAISEAERTIIEKLSRIGLARYQTILLAYYLNKPLGHDSVKFLKSLERFGFIHSFPSSRFNSVHNLTDLAIGLSQGETNINKVEEEIESWIDSFTNGPDFITDLSRSFKSSGFYEWGGIRYFLYEYDLHFREKSRSVRIKLDWDALKYEMAEYITVEHIYPQTPRQKCWTDEFRKFSPAENKILTNSLGNLVPLSKPKNSSYQNKCFFDKVDNGKGGGFRYGSYSENELTAYDSWTADTIMERGIKMLDFMAERWQLPIKSRHEKLKILNLNFVVVRKLDFGDIDETPLS